MSKFVKDQITEELASRFEGHESAVWVQIVGVDGNTTNSFRRDLHAHQMQMEVVKNSLFRRAVHEGPLARLAKEMDGPSAVIVGGESPVAIAKALKSWFEKMPGLKVRGALMEGEYLDERACVTLDKMPTKRDLQGKIAACALAPGAKLAGAIRGPGGAIAGCLKAMIEKFEKGEAIAKVG